MPGLNGYGAKTGRAVGFFTGHSIGDTINKRIQHAKKKRNKIGLRIKIKYKKGNAEMKKYRREI